MSNKKMVTHLYINCLKPLNVDRTSEDKQNFDNSLDFMYLTKTDLK